MDDDSNPRSRIISVRRTQGVALRQGNSLVVRGLQEISRLSGPNLQPNVTDDDRAANFYDNATDEGRGSLLGRKEGGLPKTFSELSEEDKTAVYKNAGLGERKAATKAAAPEAGEKPKAPRKARTPKQAAQIQATNTAEQKKRRENEEAIRIERDKRGAQANAAKGPSRSKLTPEQVAQRADLTAKREQQRERIKQLTAESKAKAKAVLEEARAKVRGNTELEKAITEWLASLTDEFSPMWDLRNIAARLRVYLEVRSSAPARGLQDITRLGKTFAPELLEQGDALAKAKDYDGAIGKYNEAIRLDPDFAAAYLNRGIAYGKMREYDREIADCSEALRLDPGFAQAFFHRGGAYVEKFDFGKAIADDTEAIRINPQYADAYSNRGFAHLMNRDYDQAIADFTGAIRLNPRHAAAYNNRGFAYQKKGEFDKAKRDFDEATRLGLEPK